VPPVQFLCAIAVVSDCKLLMALDCEVVTLTFASWNRVGKWLSRLDALRQPSDRPACNWQIVGRTCSESPGQSQERQIRAELYPSEFFIRASFDKRQSTMAKGGDILTSLDDAVRVQLTRCSQPTMFILH